MCESDPVTCALRRDPAALDIVFSSIALGLFGAVFVALIAIALGEPAVERWCKELPRRTLELAISCLVAAAVAFVGLTKAASRFWAVRGAAVRLWGGLAVGLLTLALLTNLAALAAAEILTGPGRL